MSSETKTYRGRVHEFSKELMTDWYKELASAEENGTKTAYLMISGNCVEILQAFDIVPIFPEVNSLQLAIRKEALPMILKAEEEGYSVDNCAYVKADIGYMMSGGIGDGGTIPVPDLIVCNYVGCNVYLKWFEHSAHFLNTPLVMIDVPFYQGREPTKEEVDYVVHQLKDLITKCEEVTGKRYDEDRLKEVLEFSNRAEEGWSQCKALCKNEPSPFDAYFDSINMMGPINVLRGTEGAAQFFETAVEEFKELISRNEGPIKEEKFRVVFEGPPPYPYYRNFRNLFTSWGAVGVASTYSCVGGLWEFGFRHDPDNPLESIAQQMFVENLTNRSLLDRYENIWRIHSVKSCRLFSAGQGDMRDYFINEKSLPTLLIESDLEDPRYYSQAQLKNRVDAFFEALEHQRKITQ
jgi:benzoyl-CoA reductase subunit B